MSLVAWSVAEQRNAGSFKLYPVFCSDIAQSIPAPHSAPRRQSQQNHFWKDQINLRLGFFFFRSSLSWTHFSFSTHSLRVLSPPSFAGVSCFALLLPHGAAHADPRREGGTERLLFTKDRLWLQTIFFMSLRTPCMRIKTFPWGPMITPTHNYYTIMVAVNLWSVIVYRSTFTRKYDISNI